jgi:hypothetical protein
MDPRQQPATNVWTNTGYFFGRIGGPEPDPGLVPREDPPSPRRRGGGRAVGETVVTVLSRPALIRTAAVDSSRSAT